MKHETQSINHMSIERLSRENVKNKPETCLHHKLQLPICHQLLEGFLNYNPDIGCLSHNTLN